MIFMYSYAFEADRLLHKTSITLALLQGVAQTLTRRSILLSFSSLNLTYLAKINPKCRFNTGRKYVFSLSIFKP
jgi:hypothetical protein